MANAHVPSILLLIALALPTSSRAQAPGCPATGVTCGAASESPVASSGSKTCSNADGSGSITFDLAAGEFALSFWNELVLINAIDRYRIEGLPDGTPIAVTARLEAEALVCGGDVAHIYARLSHLTEVAGTQWDAPRPTQGVGGCTGPETHSISVPIAAIAGAEFAVRVELWSDPSSGGTGNAAAVLRFEGLPPGAQLRSCKGYALDVPVAALPASWGRIKSEYR